MDYQTWIDNIDGMAGIYSFDILPDGSFSEIRLMAVNRQNMFILKLRPDAPDFYPGIHYRNYWQDINFEDFVYKCASSNTPLYSYVNAHGSWLKGFYIPISESGTVIAEIAAANEDGKQRTVYCLYIVTTSQEAETDAMVQRSSEMASAIMNLSVKLHHSCDFYQAMADTMNEFKNFCGSEKCALYTVDNSRQICELIDENGVQPEFLKSVVTSIGRTPYENALVWEKDLDESDCLLLNDLTVIKERDPDWNKSMMAFGIRNIIL